MQGPASNIHVSFKKDVLEGIGVINKEEFSRGKWGSFSLVELKVAGMIDIIFFSVNN